MIQHQEPVVITGVGLTASVGVGREEVWQALREGRCGARRISNRLGFIDGELIAARDESLDHVDDRLRVLHLLERTADEAMDDARVVLGRVNRDRFGCAVSAIMGDVIGAGRQLRALPTEYAAPWHEQFLPSTGCSRIANRYGLVGPRMCHATACASGLIEVLTSVRAIRDGACDIALAGAAEAIDPFVAASFRNMRVLANSDDPTQACRPFDKDRKGFVLGEGGAMFVIESLSHALSRGARIYAEIASCRVLSDAHHVTSLDTEADALTRVIEETLRGAHLRPSDIGYINAHGTGTQQNDLVEMRGIARAFGSAVDEVYVSSTKSMLGHMVNAAGAAELAVTALAMRDGFAPPTRNLRQLDPECRFNCLPHVGRPRQFQHALKISAAFGGHMAAVALSRWNDAESGFAYPTAARAA